MNMVKFLIMMEQLYRQFKNDLCINMYTTILTKHTCTLIPNLLQASSWGHSPPQLVPLNRTCPLPIPLPSDWPRLLLSQISYLYKYPSSLVPAILLVHMTYDDGTVFRKVGTQNSDTRESPKRKGTTHPYLLIHVNHC